MRAIVLISTTARRKIRQRLTEILASNSEYLDAAIGQIETRLASLFPQANAAIIQDLYAGFRENPDEYILLVELTRSSDHDGVYVIKIGPPDKLARELAGWKYCRPAGIRHDIVLMNLEARYHADGEKIIGLVYTDAQQLIGVDQSTSFEAAALESVRLGVPTLPSVGDTLFQLYERLGLLFYRHSYIHDIERSGDEDRLARVHEKLPRLLDVWDTSAEAFEIRASASTLTDVPATRDLYRDPVSFFRFSQKPLEGASRHHLKLFPRLLRGHSHGDLHGRNILVGQIGDRILWPAVFDYEHMGHNNLIGWDFIKMEAEIKIRSYPLLFPLPTPEFVSSVVNYEATLATMTESCRDGGRWPTPPQAGDFATRLRWLILEIRRLASHHLGTARNRGREWLAEYYFLQACYGLGSIKHHNLTPHESLTSYLVSGVACARYSWGLPISS